MFTEDLSAFFDEDTFAVSASWNGTTASVIFDAPAEDLLGGDAQGTDYSVMVPATVWPGIARGQVITVTGQGTFTVREVRPIEDGAVKRIVLGL